MEKQTLIRQCFQAIRADGFAELSALVESNSSHFERLGVFASLRRVFGDVVPVFSDKWKDSWQVAFGVPFPTHWTRADWARLCFLLEIHAQESSFLSEETVKGLFRRGDHSEQVSLARILFYLPDSIRFKDVVERLLATNSAEVFKAISLSNPYPSAFFSDLYFRQMVLKALFIDLPTKSILGLEKRACLELQRMADDYVSERTVAGRSLPIGIEYLKSLQPQVH